MLRDQLRDSIGHVGLALREPEQFALDWHRQQANYRWWVWAALTATAILGTTTYGLVMGIGSVERMFTRGALLTVAAGLAWGIPLPALYVLNSFGGSKLRASTTLLAALVTTSWGGLALIASIPITWFFTVALGALPFSLPVGACVLLVNAVVFLGVGVSMMDVFRRVIERLEPARGAAPAVWLLLVGVIGAELSFFFKLFEY